MRILGPLELVANHRLVKIGGPRDQVVLAMLALRANRVVSVGQLIDVVWGDDPPPTARGQVQTSISVLRKLLGDAGRVRYRFHDLIRVYARERLTEAEPAADRRDALARVLGAWLTLAETAHRKEYGESRVTPHGGAPRLCLPEWAGRDPVGDPSVWLAGERSALVAAIRQGAAAGLHELSQELALCRQALSGGLRTERDIGERDVFDGLGSVRWLARDPPAAARGARRHGHGWSPSATTSDGPVSCRSGQACRPMRQVGPRRAAHLPAEAAGWRPGAGDPR